MERTHCPSCGARLPDRSREMSNCLYCGLPFELARTEAATESPSPYRDRLARLVERPELEEALAAKPPPGPDWRRARKLRNRGVVLAVAGTGLAAATATRAEGGWGASVSLVGLLVAALGAWLIWRGVRAMRAQTAWPLLARACAITDRRSVTVPAGLEGRTDYHFTLEFEDGNRAEFRWPGRGSAQEPMSTGILGVAYTRGTTLLAFRQFRG